MSAVGGRLHYVLEAQPSCSEQVSTICLAASERPVECEVVMHEVVWCVRGVVHVWRDANVVIGRGDGGIRPAGEKYVHVDLRVLSCCVGGTLQMHT